VEEDRIVLRTLLCACLFAVLNAPTATAWADPAADAVVVQQTLPSLVGRAAAAEAKTSDALAFFRGELTLARAFPDLADTPLFQPGFVADARRGLLAAAKTRAAARLQEPPPDLSEEVEARWRSAWERVHRAEDAWDAAQGRLLAALTSGLSRSPDLTSQATAAQEARWAAQLAAGNSPSATGDELAMAKVAGGAMKGMVQLRKSALRYMAIPGDDALSKRVLAELSVPVPGSGTAAELAQAQARLDRVRRAAPLLPDAAEILARVEALSHAMAAGQAPAATGQNAAQVIAAQAAAAKAQQRADEAAEARASQAQIQAMVADLRSRIAAELQTEATRHGDANTRLSVHRESLSGHRADLGAALSPLIDDRTNKLNKVLRDARQTVAAIRSDRDRHQQVRDEALTRWQDVEADLQAGEISLDDPATARLASAILDYRKTHTTVLHNLKQEHAQLLQLLHEAKSVRDQAYLRSSPDVRREVPILVEIRRELMEVPELLLTRFGSYADAIRSFPAKVIQVDTLGGVLIALFQLVLLIALWAFARRHSSDWIHSGLSAVGPKSRGPQRSWEESTLPSWMIAGDIAALHGPLKMVAVSLIDAVLVAVVFSYLSPRIPLLGLLALIWLFSVLARLLPGLVGLMLITPADVRPALRLTSSGVRDRSLWTVRVLTLWAGLDSCLAYAGMEVLDAPRVSDLVQDGTLVVLVAIFLVALRRWTPEIRDKIANDGDPSPLNNWISASGVSRPGATLRAAVGLGVLLVVALIRLLTLVVEGRAGLGWLSAALARRQLKVDDSMDKVLLSSEQQGAIRNRAIADLQAPSSVDEIAEIFLQWEGEHRQGMVALIGDRGMGKSQSLDALSHRLSAEHSVVKLSIPGRISDPDVALNWLAEAAGIADMELVSTADLETRAEAVGAALSALPQTMFIVDDTHRLFLRSVGCFDALRAVLVAMQSCSNRHFWLCGFHGPAFAFLDGVSTVSHMAVFRARVRLEPVPAASLRSWLEGATEGAGLTLRYEGLLQRPAEGSHRERMVSRVSAAYWRLLAEASQGNPDVALEFWLSGLHASESNQTGAVGVGLFHSPEIARLEALGDSALFALTALIIHDGATLRELHDSLNLPEGEVRGTCRSLEAMGVIADEDLDETYEVTNRWLPAVERLLRRKSFLHRR